MNLEQRISVLATLGKRLLEHEVMQHCTQIAAGANPWFVPRFTQYAIEAISQDFLQEDKLRQWIASYDTHSQYTNSKNIGIIMAGNLPLVGFHDLLCVYLSGCNSLVKLSSKDEVLLPYLLKLMEEIQASSTASIKIVDKLVGYDAVIATGSDNTRRHFEYYFRDYPKLLRQSRSSVAILTGNESEGELLGLIDDICLYFGFGCRNVSKLYVPTGYDVRVLFPYLDAYHWMHDHNKYMNNYDYQRTLLIMNSVAHYSDDVIMLQEQQGLLSPTAVVYYEYYETLGEVGEKLSAAKDKIQCVVGNTQLASMEIIPFGHTQRPALSDYADGEDTMDFLLGF